MVSSHPHVIISPPQGSSNRTEQIKKSLSDLGVAEVVIGSVSIVVSSIVLAYVYGEDHDDSSCCNYDPSCCYYYYEYWNTGEGLWCGAWIIIGGAIGISGSRSAPLNTCMWQTHLGFSIAGAIFSAALLGMSIFFSIYYDFNEYIMGQEIFLAVEGLVALVLSIASSVQCSRLLGSQCCDGVYCDEGCCSNQVSYEGQPVYFINGQPQQPVYFINSQPQQMTQQAFIHQTPVIPTGQPTAYTGSVLSGPRPFIARNLQTAPNVLQQPMPVAIQNPTTSFATTSFSATNSNTNSTSQNKTAALKSSDEANISDSTALRSYSDKL